MVWSTVYTCFFPRGGSEFGIFQATGFNSFGAAGVAQRQTGQPRRVNASGVLTDGSCCWSDHRHQHLMTLPVELQTSERVSHRRERERTRAERPLAGCIGRMRNIKMPCIKVNKLSKGLIGEKAQKYFIKHSQAATYNFNTRLQRRFLYSNSSRFLFAVCSSQLLVEKFGKYFQQALCWKVERVIISLQLCVLLFGVLLMVSLVPQSLFSEGEMWENESAAKHLAALHLQFFQYPFQQGSSSIIPF